MHREAYTASYPDAICGADLPGMPSLRLHLRLCIPGYAVADILGGCRIPDYRDFAAHLPTFSIYRNQ